MRVSRSGTPTLFYRPYAGARPEPIDPLTLQARLEAWLNLPPDKDGYVPHFFTLLRDQCQEMELVLCRCRTVKTVAWSVWSTTSPSQSSVPERSGEAPATLGSLIHLVERELLARWPQAKEG